VQAPSYTGSCTIVWRGRWSGKGLRFGQSPSRIGSGRSSARSLPDLFGFAGLQLLEPQFELLDLPGQSLRRAAELHPPQLGDLELELLDFQGTQLDGELCCLQHPDPRNAARTRRSAFSLTLLSTRTRTPAGRSISITPTRPAKARSALRGHAAPAAIGTWTSHPMHRR
jgi:hypothetical protein